MDSHKDLDDRWLEIDLIIETSNQCLLVEIKFQEKHRPDFSRNIGEFIELYPQKKFKAFVVYLGSREQGGSFKERILPVDKFLDYLVEM